MQNPIRILRAPSVFEKTGLSRATIYRLIRQGKFPAPIYLSSQAVGWDFQEVEAWIESRKAARH